MDSATIASIVLSSISVATSIIAIFISACSDKKNRDVQKSIAELANKTQKQITTLNGKISKSNYVSQVVFDEIFSQFQKILLCLFDNYNNVNVFLFPQLEQVICFLPTTEEKTKKMIEYYQKSTNDLNDLVRLIQTNRFVLTDEMINKLCKFEDIIKELINWYDMKIRDIANNSLDKLVPLKDEIELTKKAHETLDIYNQISNIFKIYINGLQIV